MLIPSVHLANAGLAVSPGVTTGMLDQIDEIQDEPLREMLRTAVLPGFGRLHMNLDRPEEELSQFEKNYKDYPLNWEEKLENVRFILDEAEDLTTLKPESVEYMDIVFGEAVIPVQDRRVTEILDSTFLANEAQRLEEEKQALMTKFYNNGGDGMTLQEIEDQYAIKMATLVQAENQFKESKIAFLKLQNQQRYGRITDEEFNTQTLEVVQDFENFVSLAGNVPLFDEDQTKALANQIYSEAKIKPILPGTPSGNTVNEKSWYWALSAILMLVALCFGYLAFKRYKK